MRFYFFTVTALLLHFLPLSTSFIAKKVKRADLSSSNNINTENENDFQTSVSDNINIIDSDRKTMRSVSKPVDDTSTESSNKDTNTSILSQEFLSCTHTYVEPGYYVIMPNGSAYINAHNLMLNMSNYVIRDELLIYCPSYSPTSSVKTIAPSSSIYKKERIRRTIGNPSNNTTTNNASRTTTVVFVKSPNFNNCQKRNVGRTKYEKLSNDLVYVPSLNKTLNSSEYSIMKNGQLIICADTPRKKNGSVSKERTTEEITTLLNDDDSYLCNTTADSEIENYFSNNTTDESNLSPEYRNCPAQTYVEPGEYEKLPNGSVYVPVYNRLFDTANYVIKEDILLVCPDFFPIEVEVEKFNNGSEMVAFVCSWISSICIFFHIITFIVVKKLRNIPGYCLVSLCIALMAAYICTFVITFSNIENKDPCKPSVSKINCTALGMSMSYLFLSSFFWMNAMAYDVWKSIRMATSKLRLTTGRPILVQFARYSLLAWGTPLMIVCISIIIHHSVPESSKFRLTFQEGRCWFKHKQALTLYFTGPLFLLIFMNVFFFILSFYMISNAAMSNSFKGGIKKRSDLRSRLILSLRLGSVMGFTYILGIIAMLSNWRWMWDLYNVCTSLQGVFIFLSFTMNEQTRKIFMKALHSRKFSISPTQTSSQPGTSSSNRNENEQSV